MKKLILIPVLISFVFLTSEMALPTNNPQFELKDGKKYFHIPKINSKIEIDGFINETVWEQAVKIEANIEVRPGENIPAPVTTEVRLMYDDSHIYVGFIAKDPDPSKIRAHYCDRDNIFDDDWILILFDTFNDQRRTYDFGCNPLGIQADFIESTTGGGDEWDAIWESYGRIHENGYVVEMAIPFSSFGFPRTNGEQIWGFDVVRSYPRNVRHHIGAFPRDRNNNCYMCQSDKLMGFAGAKPGKNIEFDPTLSAILTQARENETNGRFIQKEHQYEPGLTTRWGITPNMTLNTTLNPDFSNVEADILQLDINTRFAIYYPEKRPFFMEGADFFQTPLDIVHTRTLAEPDWGIKLTGKEGKNALGFYTVQDNMTNFLFPGVEGSESKSIDKKSYGSVFRYRRDLFKSSNIGVMMTDREGNDYHNRLAGIDGDFKFTPKDQIKFQLVSSKTQYPDSINTEFSQSVSDFSGMAYSILYSRDTKNYEFYGLHRQVDQDFRADLGFITQAGYQYSELGAEYKWRHDPGHWYTYISATSEFAYRRTQSGGLLNKENINRIQYEGPYQSHGHWQLEIAREKYNQQEFDLKAMQGCVGLRPISPVFVHLYWRYGNQIDYANTRKGNRFLLQLNSEINLGKHLKLELDHIFEQLNVPDGRLYTANISRMKMIYQFNRRIFLRGILQYKDYRRNTSLYNDEVDAKTRKLFSQLLFSYKINPQTVFFLGYSDDYYGDVAINLIQTNRTFFAKLGYAYML
ncbi:carbohydrate binding family 9 domain-containing protein [candidate division KSB1 bacterium]|nr:carbohydrate binding family 9 domain-containing protein [candidate division KSB1 bacterium]